jgi:hypothetical protein
VPEGHADKVCRRFLSTERDHIVQAMGKLANALPAEVLDDPASPLVVSVKGARCIGKSLIPFAFREALFDGAPSLEGRAEFDERWKGAAKDGRRMEIGFVNLVWPFFDMSESLQALYPAERPGKQDIADAFLGQRELGGVTFISFAEKAEKTVPGIVIEMARDSLGEHLPEEKRLSKKFLEAMCGNSLSPWLRIVKIEVSDPRLLKSEQFMAALSSLRAVYGAAPSAHPARQNKPSQPLQAVSR